MPPLFITPFARIPPKEFAGSENPDSRAEFLMVDKNSEFHSSGRSALFSIPDRINFPKGGRIFLPRCFCPKICRALGKFFEVKFFDDIPSEPSPRFQTISGLRKGDLVLAVNFFGLLRDWGKWDEFRAANPEAVFVEDHSHAPFCARSKSSPNVVASFRKILPIPDGAFSRISDFSIGREARAMFKKPSSGMRPFAADSLAGACMAEFERKRCEAENLFYSAEGKLNAEISPSRMSGYSLETFRSLKIGEMLSAKLKNFSLLKSALFPEIEKYGVEMPEFPNDPDEIFFPVLKFPSEKMRDKCFAFLADRGAFCSIYWGALEPGQATKETLEEISRRMIVPLNFNNSASEAEILSDSILEFSKKF